MEGCLYKHVGSDNYYMVCGVGSYFILVKDFNDFGERFIQKDEIALNYKSIDFNSNNVKQLLDNYDRFEGNINYSNLKDFYLIIYNDRKYFIRTWKDIYEFIIKN
jgi:hypothetical protein